MILFSSKLLNTAGLIFDIIGAYLILRFGVSKRSKEREEEGTYTSSWNPSPKDSESLDEYRDYIKMGFVLILVGFILQLASNWSEDFLIFIRSI